MTDLERMAIEHACAQLQIRFHICIDTFQHDKILDMFAPDGTWDQVIKGMLRGHKEIKGYLDKKYTGPVTKHVNTNNAIDVIDENHAKGLCYYTYYHAEPGTPVPCPLNGPSAVGQYDDTFVRTPQGWKFASRSPRNHFQVDFSGYSIVRP